MGNPLRVTPRTQILLPFNEVYLVCFELLYLLIVFYLQRDPFGETPGLKNQLYVEF